MYAIRSYYGCRVSFWDSSGGSGARSADRLPTSDAYLLLPCYLLIVFWLVLHPVGRFHLGDETRITSYNVCYTKLLRFRVRNGNGWILFAMTAVKQMSVVRGQKTVQSDACGIKQRPAFVLYQYNFAFTPEQHGDSVQCPLEGYRNNFV